MLACLVGLTGTDFTRNLPLLSGRSLYDMLETLWLPLASCYDASGGQLRVDSTADVLVSLIYAEKYSNHVKGGASAGFDWVRLQMLESKLGDRTKQQLPTRDRVLCTVRNVNWLLRYWECGDDTPEAVQEEFGYGRWPAPRGRTHPGKVGFLDEIAAGV